MPIDVKNDKLAVLILEARSLLARLFKILLSNRVGELGLIGESISEHEYKRRKKKVFKFL